MFSSATISRFNHVDDRRFPPVALVPCPAAAGGPMDDAGSPTSHRSSTARRPLPAELGMLAPVLSPTSSSLLHFVRTEPRGVSKPESAASQVSEEKEALRDGHE